MLCLAQVVSSLPPARLAGAMMGGRGDLQDMLLVERLEWLRDWLMTTAHSDPDQQVATFPKPLTLFRAMSYSCNICGAVAEGKSVLVCKQSG